MKRSGKKRAILTRILPALLLVLAVTFIIYTSVYYHADRTALESMQSDDTVSVEKIKSGWLFDGPLEDDLLIFYPGAKVEETAYAPLLHELASRGMDVCLVKMPFRLAFFDMNAAGDILDSFGNDYAHCYIGGHSLGGAMAAIYAAEHPDGISGVVLLAAYPTKKLPDSMTELSIVGSEDHVVNREKILEGRQYAPERLEEYVIEGGNHAQFGSYGEQRGDGAARISPEEQVEETVGLILESLG